MMVCKIKDLRRCRRLMVAASCDFPVLTMAMFWRSTTTRGAAAGGLAGLLASVLLVVLSKTVWVAVFHFATALFPYENPALFSIPLAFLFTWLFSVTDHSERAFGERKSVRGDQRSAVAGDRGPANGSGVLTAAKHWREAPTSGELLNSREEGQ
jgi:Na+/proline symporter